MDDLKYKMIESIIDQFKETASQTNDDFKKCIDVLMYSMSRKDLQNIDTAIASIYGTFKPNDLKYQNNPQFIDFLNQINQYINDLEKSIDYKKYSMDELKELYNFIGVNSFILTKQSCDDTVHLSVIESINKSTFYELHLEALFKENS